MFATRTIIVAAAALAGIGTANAEPKPPVASVAAPAAAGQSAQADNQRYCFREAMTGTRIERTVCKTKSEWSAMGVKLPARY